MKLLTIEKVDNGYVVTNKPDSRGDCSAIYDADEHGIHVFETFGSMSKWLEGHFEPPVTAKRSSTSPDEY